MPDKGARLASWDLRAVRFATLPTPLISDLPLLNLTGSPIAPVQIDCIGQALVRHGLSGKPGPMVRVYGSDLGQYQPTIIYEKKIVSQIDSIRAKYPPRTVLLVVIRKHDYDIYAAIKRAAELWQGMKVVCCTLNALTKANPPRADLQTSSNIALKFAIKAE